MSIKKSRVLLPGSGDICFTFNNNLINQNIDQAQILQYDTDSFDLLFLFQDQCDIKQSIKVRDAIDFL